jgi:hypothetical protein
LDGTGRKTFVIDSLVQGLVGLDQGFQGGLEVGIHQLRKTLSFPKNSLPHLEENSAMLQDEFVPP